MKRAGMWRERARGLEVERWRGGNRALPCSGVQREGRRCVQMPPSECHAVCGSSLRTPGGEKGARLQQKSRTRESAAAECFTAARGGEGCLLFSCSSDIHPPRGLPLNAHLLPCALKCTTERSRACKIQPRKAQELNVFPFRERTYRR